LPEYDAEKFRSIKTFGQLVKYLRDELYWPIEDYSFDDITFDYDPEELGIDPKNAAKIQEIKQLRPLVTGQPWGIFFIKFEPKKLPVAVLRKILSKLVTKKRASSQKSEQASWHSNDLLFISNYGEGDGRQITFAQFSQNEDELPALKVLGWDDADTVLHIEHVHHELKEKLRWPDDEGDIGGWQERWSSAFILRPREVITTSKVLSERLAQLATEIRNRVASILQIETEKGALRKVYADCKTALIHDLSEDDFADMYAQTITYGLLTARMSQPEKKTGKNVSEMIPVTNPFLRDLLSTFLTIGGRKGKIDFDEVGINDVVQMLNDAKMEEVLRDFGDRKPEEDPVIFFYEDFLKAYDPKRKVKRGVFYTPRPVVSFIVQSINELLKKEFALEDGLADTSTWGEMAKKHNGLNIPEGVKPTDCFVQILDPATGTGTFLVEVVEVIHGHLVEKWKKQGADNNELNVLWNEYVPKYLLPRLYGYEIMMAPYAIAHMKIGLKLHETGYCFDSNERAHIYLTNTLEPPTDIGQLSITSDAIANEADAVNDVKKTKRFTSVIGNPPYSLYTANLTEHAKALIKPYKAIEGKAIEERGALQLEKNLQDDYVKFLAFGSDIIRHSGVGLLSYVSNEGYIGNKTLRGLRYALLKQFKEIFVIDLHGSTSRSSGVELIDENVFDIQQGVAIGIFVQASKRSLPCTVLYRDLFGDRLSKYKYLLENSVLSIDYFHTEVQTDYFYFYPQNLDLKGEYDAGIPLDDIFSIYSTGVTTARDSLTIRFSDKELITLLRRFTSFQEEDARAEYSLGQDRKDWKVAWAQSDVHNCNHDTRLITPILYRPFDIRYTFYSGKARGFICNPRRPVMRNMLYGNNIALCTNAQVNNDFSHVLVTRYLVNDCTLSTATRERTYAFPLFKYSEDSLFETEGDRSPNFQHDFMRIISKCYKTKDVDQDMANKILNYIYTILHSMRYRTRYIEFLRTGFPRIPFSTNGALFDELSFLGEKLVSLHLMESPLLDKYITMWLGEIPSIEIEQVVYSDETVWINKSKSEGFTSVSEDIWRFTIGGYQVCQKWLKDRGPKKGNPGRRLSEDDIDHYQRIVVAINETIKIMSEIDEVIDSHGGWPDAFIS
jgi:hypothetical protein